MCTAPSHHHHHEYSSRVWSPMSVCSLSLSLSLRMCSQLALCWSPCFCRNRTSPHLEWVSEGGSEHFCFFCFVFFFGLKLETEIARLCVVRKVMGSLLWFLFYFLKIVGREWWRNSWWMGHTGWRQIAGRILAFSDLWRVVAWWWWWWWWSEMFMWNG